MDSAGIVNDLYFSDSTLFYTLDGEFSVLVIWKLFIIEF